jgi:predicted MPP superfamily phosphohydrolase
MARRRARSGVLLARFLAYELLCWTALAIVAQSAVRGGAWVALALAVYTTVPLLLFLRWRGWPFYPGAVFRLLVVRVLLYTQLLLPFVGGAALLGLLLGWPFGRSFETGRTLAVVVLGVALLLLLYGYVGSRTLVVREVEARVPRLAAEFDGLRIAQISDLHVGPHTSRRFLRAVADTVTAAAPDVIAVTGDLVDDRAEDVTPYATALGSLRAPLGVFLIPGNHDVYAGWEAVEAALRRELHATILVNDAEVIRRGSAALAIVGTGDPAGAGRGRGWVTSDTRAGPDVARAMSRVPKDSTVIAFAHNPALWPLLAKQGVSLTLSGHTHWGQLALPRLGWSLASPFLEHAMGGHQIGDALLYINPGTGYWGIPFRIGALPEVTIVTLRRGEEAEITVGTPRRAA